MCVSLGTSLFLMNFLFVVLSAEGSVEGEGGRGTLVGREMMVRVSVLDILGTKVFLGKEKILRSALLDSLTFGALRLQKMGEEEELSWRWLHLRLLMIKPVGSNA